MTNKSKTRERVSRGFSPGDFDEFAKLIGLPQAPHQFRKDIISAVAECVSHYEDDRRGSKIRAAVQALANRAGDAMSALRDLVDAVDAVPGGFRDLLKRRWWQTHRGRLGDICREADRLRYLAMSARSLARDISDEGGPSDMNSFAILADGLADAFERHTGQLAQVKYNPHRAARNTRHSGPFIELVEAVLPRVKALAAVNGSHFKFPYSRSARGEYLRKFLQARRRTPPAPVGANPAE
jgi:hypothetical protein